MILEYPSGLGERRHGPRGYLDYQSFKPWLRDEFCFQCAYCLWRENWCSDGDNSFSVDHVESRHKRPELVGHYENLVYACCRCNSIKQDSDGVVEPVGGGWAIHLEAASDGTVTALTPGGERMIEICRLNRPALVEARRIMLQLFQTLSASDAPEAKNLLDHYLGFPANLPDLARRKPPGGNMKPAGIAMSFFERRQRGELPERY